MKREEVEVIKKRKTRSDKKRDVKPTISNNLKNCVYRLSYITNTPVKEVVEIICEKGLKSRNVMEYLSQYFRRDFHFLNTIYFGDPTKESLQRKDRSRDNERITTRFTQQTFNEISRLSNALDVTPSKATAILLEASIHNTSLLNAFVKRYLHNHIEDNRMKELKQVLKYINQDNPYQEEISWFSLLSWILEDMKESTYNVKQAVKKWLEKYN